MSRILLHLRGIGLTFGGRPILENAELAVAEGERVALVGRNGSGKSTLLKIAAGMIEADKGERWLQPGTTIRYLPQEPDLSAHATVLDYVEAGLGPADDPHRERVGDGGPEFRRPADRRPQSNEPCVFAAERRT